MEALRTKAMINTIRPQTVTLLGKFIRPLVDAGIVTVAEQREILANLKHLANETSAAVSQTSAFFILPTLDG